MDQRHVLKQACALLAAALMLGACAGVRQVDSLKLEVTSELETERRRDKFTVLPDDVQLKRAVQDALLYDPRVRGMKIDVRVRMAAVSLLGNVPSLAAKRAAEGEYLRNGERTAQWKRKLDDPQIPIRDILGDDFFDKD